MLVSPRQAPIVALAGAEQGKAAPALPGLTRLRYESCLSLEEVSFLAPSAGCIALARAPELPESVTNPFAIHRGTENGELDRTIENAKRDGVRVHQREFGSQHAGQIQSANSRDVFRLPDPQLSKRSAKPFQCAMNCCSIPPIPRGAIRDPCPRAWPPLLRPPWQSKSKTLA